MLQSTVATEHRVLPSVVNVVESGRDARSDPRHRNRISECRVLQSPEGRDAEKCRVLRSAIVLKNAAMLPKKHGRCRVPRCCKEPCAAEGRVLQSAVVLQRTVWCCIAPCAAKRRGVAKARGPRS